MLGRFKKQNYAWLEAVVDEALKALAKGQSNGVTGGVINQFLVNSGRLLPREAAEGAVGKMVK